MKIKTSITLSKEVLQWIDRYLNQFNSRSEFLEYAALQLISHLKKLETERHDLKLINQNAKRLNNEAKDVLAYQAPL